MFIQCQYINECMSQIVVYNGIVYLVGQVGEDMFVGVEQQICEILVVIECLLEEVGIDKIWIFLVIIYLKDIDVDFEGMNCVWDQWLLCGVVLVCVIVEVKFCELEILVEMLVVVVLF